MIAFPNCKINLGLRILRKRKDGFHDLETVFYPLPLHDVIEVIHDPAADATGPHFSVSGRDIPGDTAQNLCLKAWQLLKNDFPQLPAARMHLHKTIPLGAGLGGGSADAAFMLQLLNDKFHLDLPADRLLHYAARLGSDCPFFLVNRPCLGTGRGEVLTPLTLDLSAWSFILVYPGIPMPTHQAFSMVMPAPDGPSIESVLRQPMETWREELVNDFEKPVLAQHPGLRSIKEKLYDAGALYASMTGSGSCFYGIFPPGPLPVIPFDPAYTVFPIAPVHK